MDNYDYNTGHTFTAGETYIKGHAWLIMDAAKRFVIGLSNGNEVPKEFRPYKQMIKRITESHKKADP